jgi:hypothetical protein
LSFLNRKFLWDYDVSIKFILFTLNFIHVF